MLLRLIHRLITTGELSRGRRPRDWEVPFAFSLSGAKHAPRSLLGLSSRYARLSAVCFFLDGKCKRRVEDSNLRSPYGDNGFRDRRFKPLSQLSSLNPTPSVFLSQRSSFNLLPSILLSQFFSFGPTCCINPSLSTLLFQPYSFNPAVSILPF